MIKIMSGIAIFALCTSTSQAYDVHHPDPMSILNGHSHSHPHSRAAQQRAYDIVEVEQAELNKKNRLQPGRMYRRHKERRYIIKPEPFSLESKKNDPELLGPQRTYAEDNNATLQEQSSNKTIASSSTKETMTKDSCISLIGEDKFNSYVEKYNGESGALKRCLIIKRTRG